MTAIEFVKSNLHRFKTTPYEHQIAGVAALLNLPYSCQFDDMGLGKSKQVIDTACLLYESGEINLVVIVAPANLRGNWSNKKVGEIVTHCWLPHVTFEFHSAGLKRIYETTPNKPRLAFVVTNYEFIRQDRHLKNLKDIITAPGRKVWLVADESSFIASYRSSQTQAMMDLKRHVKRRTIMNGTPVGNSVETLFSQMNWVDERILGIQFVTHFRHRYCILEDVRKKDPTTGRAKIVTLGGGAKLQRVTGIKNGEELQKKIKPYVVRRLKEDCLDLPPIVDVPTPVTLSESTWKLYKEMREEAISLLPDEKISMAPHAITKIMRMAQLCSGILGGVEDELGGTEKQTVVVSSEKRQFIRQFLKDKFSADENFRIIIWTRFRLEQELLAQELKSIAPIVRVYGAQPEIEREQVRFEMKSGKGPIICLGQPQAGGLGWNFTSASYSMYCSQDYNLLVRLQSRDRTHRIGQLAAKVTNYDLIAFGPRGESTIDHVIVAALQRKENIAHWTTAAWKSALSA
jgi:SNF2 family DNA or RNA helicase